MAGRGGRGAQLLQALELPARKPQNVGQPPPSQVGQSQPPAAPGQQHFSSGPQQRQQQLPGDPPQQGQQHQYGLRPNQQHPNTQQQQFGQRPMGQQRPMGPGPQNSQFGGQGMNTPLGQFQRQRPPQGPRPQRGQYPLQGQFRPHAQSPSGGQFQPVGQFHQDQECSPVPQGQFPQRGPPPQRGPFQGGPQGQQRIPRGPFPRQQGPPQQRGQFQPRGPQPQGGRLPMQGQQQGSPRGPQPMGRGAPMGRVGPPQQNFRQRPPPPGQHPGVQQGMRQPQQSFARGGPFPGGLQTPDPQPSTFPQRSSFPQQSSPVSQQPSPVPQQQAPQQQAPQQQAGGPPTLALQQMSLQEKRVAPNTQTGEKGTAGKQVPLSVNYVPVRCKTEGVFQYCVSYSPEVDSRGMRYRLLYDHSDMLGETRAFDGIQLFLPYQLQQQPTILKSTRPTDGAEITLTVQMVKFVEPDQCVQLYNIIFRKVMRSLQMQQVGRYYYDPTRPAQIPQHKLELWPGYITSIAHYEGGLMLLADVSHRLLRTETVLEYLHEIYQTNRQNFHDVATKMLVGTIVLTRYNNKTYRIDDIEWDHNPKSTFMFHTGQTISYVDYYKKNYNKEITNHTQPLLIHRPKQKREPNKAGKKPPLEIVMLIPELCSMTGLTDAMRKDFRVMKDLAVHTRVTPMQREECMRKFLANVNATPEAKKHLSIWGLELDSGLLRTDGRLLPPEKIKFGATAVTSNPQADWGREAVKEAVITPVALNSWVVVFTKKDQSKALDFVQTMKQVTPAMGIGVNDPIVLEAQNDRTETYLRTIRDHLNPGIQMVVIIFPTSRDDRYAAVKKLCCVECPVPSQVINARTISQQNKLRSVTQKIALQINCKLGGELWALDIPLKSLMVIGIDVYHDASRGGRSVGGFVASTNRSLTRWYSRVCFQTPGQELVDGLKMCLTAALKKFHEVNHTLPEKIIVFRDGVGDGQLNTVGSYEVPQLSECFALFGESYQPQMAMIVVQKRINTRVFSFEARGGQHMLDNPGPGTVLDHTVTRKDWYDFFLISQHVRQGTVTPTHYIVVHNSSSLKPDHVQRLSYKLTHLYYNWPGTVRVPAPCQYAHKLAYLVGTSIHKDPALALSDRLFYL